MDARVEERFAALLERGELPLPLLPEAAAQVMAAIDHPDCDAPRIAGLLRRDPSLAANVMRLACSPMFSATGRIASLTQVVLRLGFSAIKQLALVVASRSRVFQVAGFTDVVRETFRHSLLCALFAQEIARVRRANVEEAFTAGLLHDIGRPLLLQVLVDLHRGHALAPEPQEVLAAAQAEHARAGAALVESWLLPARVAEAVRSHHAPAGELSHEVALADALAHGGPSPQADLAAAALNLYPEDVDALARRGDDLARMMEQLA